MATLATSPNSALPVGFRKKIAADTGADATKHAAGILFVAPDGDILLLRRSKNESNFAGHFALPGGGVEEGETPLQGAAREAIEEMGGDDIEDMIFDTSAARPIHRTVTPTGVAFHTFAVPVQKPFAPRLNDEHSGYVWASLDALPKPLHPAVESMLQEQVGLGEDGEPEAIKAGLLKWMSEEAAEPEHALDSDEPLGRELMALDRDTVRTVDRDGRMKVSRARITKANICPYRGKEIPGWQKLGLDPDRVYQLLRAPEELEKAAPSLNGVPLLRIHTPVSADDPKPHEVVGSIGTSVEWDGECLWNALAVNVRDAIDGIASDERRELSAGYHYTPEMIPGTFKGKPYDGVMREISFNHVALVEQGRAGPEMMVGDSADEVLWAMLERELQSFIMA